MAARAGSAPPGSSARSSSCETDPHDPDRLFAATLFAGFSGFWTTLYRSLDGGASWTQRQQLIGPVSGPQSCEVAFDAVEPGIVYASYGGIPSIDRSEDGGETFTGFPSPFSGALLASAADGDVDRDGGHDGLFQPRPR